MKCPRCQQENATAQEFCGHCGSPVGGMVSSGSYGDLQAEIERLRRSLDEASEQQTATAEILHVISDSPTDLQAVLDAVAASAARLCDSVDAQIFRVDGMMLRIAASYGQIPKTTPAEGRPIGRGSVNGRAVLDRRTIHVHDLAAESDTEFPEGKAYQKRFGHRTIVATPLLHQGTPIGAITIRRMEVRPFSEKETKLLETFADQAVIAIENARLLNETKEALEQQTATSEILRVIASSPTNVQPVFDTILASATTLLGGFVASITRRVDDDVHMVAFTSMGESLDATVRQSYPVSIDSPNPHSVAIRRCEPHIISDADTQPDIPEPVRRMARARGWRSNLAVPLRRTGSAIGALGVSRRDARGFTPDEIALLQTFADQAVIAIENVRLFNELQEKNRALTAAHAQVTEALDQQTATSEILRVISSSPTDAQPVFDEIVTSAARLCSAMVAVVLRLIGDQLHLAAHWNTNPEWIDAARREYPMPADEGISGLALRERRVVHVPDIEADDRFPFARRLAWTMGYRSIIFVPMLHEGVAVGTLGVGARSPFSDPQIETLKTFADQAVIAIENVRLFRELQARNQDLTTALDRQTSTAEILRVISGSPTDIQPVFDAIVRSGAALCHAPDVLILIADDDSLRVAASVGPVAASVQTSQVLQDGRLPLTRGFVSGRAFIDRRTVHIYDVGAMPDDEFPEGKALQRAYGGHGTTLAVPLLRDNVSLGVITLLRNEVSPFSDQQIKLLQTFADQAVIAIENVRLFTELQQKNEALTQAHGQVTEALERQMATSDILRVIASSPTDAQPVFDTIAASAKRLCDALHSSVFQFDGEWITLVAADGSPQQLEVIRRAYPAPPGRTSLAAKVILERRVIAIADAQNDIEHPLPERAKALGFRSVVCVPMLRGDTPIGAIAVVRAEAIPFADAQVTLLQTFADQAVIAIENVRLFTELQEKNKALTAAHAQVSESLGQQTATSEILRVISQSPTDVQPVFDTIAKSAVRLCDGLFSAVIRFDGKLQHLVAEHNFTPAASEAWRRVFPMPPSRINVSGRAILDRAVTHIEDIEADPEVGASNLEAARTLGYRSVVSVPMLRDGQPLGSISVARRDVAPFATKEIELLKTFADQAVIAIENVRLFTETKEALEQQTATSDILKVISSSPTDVQPVFDTIAQSALRLCEGAFSVVLRYDGESLHLAAHAHARPEGVETMRQLFPVRPSRINLSGRAILERTVVHVADVREDQDYNPALSGTLDFRTGVAVPMLRDREPAGAIFVGRLEVRPFTDKQIAILQTFADQAAIAIENVRLFKELQEKNRALTAAHAQVTEALDQQTATSEILRVISGSPTDVQPVFETIAQNARRLCEARFSHVLHYDGERLELVAHDGLTPEGLAALRGAFPLAPSRRSAAGRSVLSRAVEHIPDVDTDPEYGLGAAAKVITSRAVVAVPMLRDGLPAGVIVVARSQPGPFADRQIDLLKTFADQAVIATENVRLFRELEARTQDLTRSVGELQALNEVGQAISSTLDLQAVLSTIVARATHLSGTDAGVIYEYDDQREIFLPRATAHLEAEIVETMLATPVRKGEGATGRLAEAPEPIQVPDILAAPAESRVRGALVQAGYRALLAIPLVREGHLIGGLTVIRRATGAFAPGTIELLQTFATQSSLAIQNARLFREIEEKSRQLEVASQHKSEFLANMSHELRTPLNAIIGFSEVLTDRMFGELNEKQDEYLKDIHASGQHLLSLINDILDLSKIEAGKMELEVSDFDLPMVIDNALMLVRERAARRGIELHRTVDERLGQIQGDERKIRQVLLNLLSNAIKFTPEGGRIEVGAKPVGSSIEVSVTDTGVGIAPEDQEAVFEEFRQVGMADKKVEGTGLGLALSRKFIELHGGKIGVKSEVGQGSTFTFTLPMRRVTEETSLR
jgi:GAF domain-containing protein